MCCGMKIVKTAACQPINLFELDERHSTLRPCNLVVNGSWRSIILQQQQQQLWKKYALHSCIRMCSTATHATSQTNNIPIRMAYVFISITYFMLFLALTYQHYNFISLHVRIIECNSFFCHLFHYAYYIHHAISSCLCGCCCCCLSIQTNIETLGGRSLVVRQFLPFDKGAGANRIYHLPTKRNSILIMILF